MIDEIQVKNVALISNATLEPASGMTVLTGETGAGKTALISALKLLMGDRANVGTIRDGQQELQVSGRFYFKDDQGLWGDEVVAIRKLNADGRSRVTIDGDMASVGGLSTRIAPTVDLCGQNEHQQLTRPTTHGALLDSWVGPDAAQALAGYRRAFDVALQAREALEEVLNAQSANDARIDQARFVLQRINAVNPQLDEYDQLAEDLNRAEYGEVLAQAANTVYDRLTGEDGALDALNTAIAALDGAAAYDSSLGEMAQNLRQACFQVEDTAADARRYRDKVDFDPQTLVACQERMAAIQGLMRSFGPRLEDVIEKRDQAKALLEMVDDDGECERRARKQLDAANKALREAGGALAALRDAAAPEFSGQVTAQMARLEMGSARLDCQVDLLPFERWTKAGPQLVEFMFRPGAGMQPRPLAKIASGGEISRVMLAIKAVLGASDTVDTLVFDEVDAGTGGATAHALAEVLAELAQTHQVIVVTHLAQVAVRADAHYVVHKTGGDLPETQLTRLAPQDRPQEIARMLSGEITPTSLAHARELLERASR